jgi:hypothetical protein
LPILKDSILHKGVYRSFAEFKNNKPSIENFEIGKGNFTDELYVADNHETYPLQDFWGYCDGKNLFVRSANNLFQLYRTGNTFNTKAFKSLKKAKYSIGAAAEQIGIGLLTRTAGDLILINPKNPQDKYRVVTSAFQLNMQTGEIF